MKNKDIGKDTPTQSQSNTATKSAPNSEFYSDWFYDELMTSQPEATREFLRQRMLSSKTPEPADAD